MTELEQNLVTILTEKQNKIIPENIKKDINIFGVTGTLEATTLDSNIKLYSTIEERDNDTNIKADTISLVYNTDETANWDSTTPFQEVAPNKELPLEIANSLIARVINIAPIGRISTFLYTENFDEDPSETNPVTQLSVNITDKDMFSGDFISLTWILNEDKTAFVLAADDRISLKLESSISLGTTFQSVFPQMFKIIKSNFTGLYKSTEKTVRDLNKITLIDKEGNIELLDISFYNDFNTEYNSSLSASENTRLTNQTIIKDDQYIWIYQACASVFITKDNTIYLAEYLYTNTTPTTVKKYNLEGELIETTTLEIRTDPIYYLQEEIDWDNDGVTDYVNNIGFYPISEFNIDNIKVMNISGNMSFTEIINQDDKEIITYRNMVDGIIYKNIIQWNNLSTQLSKISANDLTKDRIVYTSNGIITGTYDNSNGIAAYYNPDTGSGINYVLQTLNSKFKNIGDYQFEVELLTPTFSNNTGPYGINLGVRPINFKLQSMNLTMKLLSSTGEIVWQCLRGEVGITNTQYYKGEEYWTLTDSGFTSEYRPTVEQFMNAFDFDVEISDIVENT